MTDGGHESSLQGSPAINDCLRHSESESPRAAAHAGPAAGGPGHGDWQAGGRTVLTQHHAESREPLENDWPTVVALSPCWLRSARASVHTGRSQWGRAAGLRLNPSHRLDIATTIFVAGGYTLLNSKRAKIGKVTTYIKRQQSHNNDNK